MATTDEIRSDQQEQQQHQSTRPGPSPSAAAATASSEHSLPQEGASLNIPPSINNPVSFKVSVGVVETSKRLTVQDVRPTHTIGFLKQKLRQICGVEENNVQFIFDGAVLTDDAETVEDVVSRSSKKARDGARPPLQFDLFIPHPKNGQPVSSNKGKVDSINNSQDFVSSPLLRPLDEEVSKGFQQTFPTQVRVNPLAAGSGDSENDKLYSVNDVRNAENPSSRLMRTPHLAKPTFDGTLAELQGFRAPYTTGVNQVEWEDANHLHVMEWYFRTLLEEQNISKKRRADVVEATKKAVHDAVVRDSIRKLDPHCNNATTTQLAPSNTWFRDTRQAAEFMLHVLHTRAARASGGQGPDVGRAVLPPGFRPRGAQAEGVRQQRQRPRRQILFQFNFNWIVVSRLLLVAFLVSQGADISRFYVLIIVMVITYLWQAGHLNALRRAAQLVLPTPNEMLQAMFPQHRRNAQNQQDNEQAGAQGDINQRRGPEAVPADAEVGHNENNVQERSQEHNAVGTEERARNEVPAATGAQAHDSQRDRQPNRLAVGASLTYSFFYGFICSLLPTWTAEAIPNFQNWLFRNRNNNDNNENAINANNGADGNRHDEQQEGEERRAVAAE